jgi:hypothetical protein
MYLAASLVFKTLFSINSSPKFLQVVIRQGTKDHVLEIIRDGLARLRVPCAALVAVPAVRPDARSGESAAAEIQAMAMGCSSSSRTSTSPVSS